RCYPLGGRGFHVLGESVRQTNWAANNVSFVERDEATILQGFDDGARFVQRRTANGKTQAVLVRDYRELLPLVRHKGNPDHDDVRRVIQRSRDIQLTLDGTLQ